MAVLNPTRAAGMTQAQIAAWNLRNNPTGVVSGGTPSAPAPTGVASPFGTATTTNVTAPVSVTTPAPTPVVTPPPATPVPKLPPPNPWNPEVVAVTGGNAPVSTAPVPPANTVYNNGAGTVAQPQSPPPPIDTASMITGTTAPRPTGGNAPVSTAPVPATPFPTINSPQQVYTPNMGAGNVVQDYLSQILNDESGYIQNARRNGIELAAQRGLLNSSIAAGNSQRAAIEAAQPILNEITQLHNQREQLAFTGEQNQMDRDQQITMAQINDWAANNQFNREYNGQLSLLPITSVTALNNQLMQAAIENPEIFPPEIVSGLGEFFGTNLLSMLQQWFPEQYGGG